jgi:hypothetical protein
MERDESDSGQQLTIKIKCIIPNDEKKPFEVSKIYYIDKSNGLSSLDFHSENL